MKTRNLFGEPYSAEQIEEIEAERADHWHDQRADREAAEHATTMQQKRHLENLLHLCSDQPFVQDAIEWAIISGWISLSYQLDKDLRLIMGEPGKPETGQYDAIIEAYRRVRQQAHEALIESYAPLMEEILRPVPLAKIA
jgi:hypothetical protein